MITVTFTEKGKRLSLRVEGHARYAEHGKDIVCASASILTYTLASIVDSIDGVKTSINLDSGDSTIDCECEDNETFAMVADVYAFAKRGYVLLAQNYPQYVRLMP